MEEFVMFGVPTLAFGLFAVIGYYVTKARSRTGWITLASLWTIFSGAMVVALYNATGWDGLLYVIGLMFISAPTAVGTLAGAMTAWVKGSKPLPAAV